MSDTIGALLKQASLDEDNSSVSSARREFKDSEEAESFFSRVKRGLLAIPLWNENATLSKFELFDDGGRPNSNGTLYEGAFLRISLTGSGKDDWVRVEKIFDTEQEVVITVRPTYDPTADNPDPKTTSHFFTAESTNNFCANIMGKTVNAYVIGLNEKQNTAETDSMLEAARNVAAANIGSYLGIQKGEWTTFCENFLFPDRRS